MNEKLENQIYTLIEKVSTDLPPDVENMLRASLEKEANGSTARSTLQEILTNVKMAREKKTPMCQDTGCLIFYIDLPHRTDEREYREAACAAAARATKNVLLRPNAVDPITGKNSGNNLGERAPYFHFNYWDSDSVRIRLMAKGGGSENVCTQYKLPDAKLKAGRDLSGVKNVVLDAVLGAQGKGCAPGVIGVGIGGDRTTSYMLAKEQLFRKIGDRSTDERLAKLESELYENCNSLEIGPMGFGGKTTVLEVFCAAQHRHPATFYVSIAYMCWACRRKTMTILKSGEVKYD